MYNFLSAATFPKQECEESSGSSRSSTSEGLKEQDIFSDESVQKELTSAGYELTFSVSGNSHRCTRELV